MVEVIFMSDYGEEIIERLNANSPLHDLNNPMRKIILNTIGEFLDRYENEEFFEQIFIATAKEDYLDLHGVLYDVYRKPEESDDDFRQRIIYEMLGHLTINYLLDIYDVKLYNYARAFDIENNTLTSDNYYITNEFMSPNTDMKGILMNKFILGEKFVWIENGSIDYILSSTEDLYFKYINIYKKSSVVNFFREDRDVLKKVRLSLPNASLVEQMFYYCSALESVLLDLPLANDISVMFTACSSLFDVQLNVPNCIIGMEVFGGCTSLKTINLDLPRLRNCTVMFYGCSSLEDVTLNIPVADVCNNIFQGCGALKNINLTVMPTMEDWFLTYIDGLDLQYLESLIINGVEYVE